MADKQEPPRKVVKLHMPSRCDCKEQNPDNYHDNTLDGEEHNGYVGSTWYHEP